MSDKLFNRFCSVVDGLSLKPGHQIIIALGGGADSQTLLDLTMRYRQQHPDYNYLAVHLDHSFHPNSGQWSRIIENAAKTYAVATCFEPLEVTVAPRQSKEAAGRERRYQRLRELSADDAVILLGQHRNDQIETFLLQLNRGSGPKGLASMAEVHCWFEQRRLVRPLLAISKQEIYDYANQRELTWVEDDTNFDTRIERNFLRHDVIPQLEQRWPQFGDSVLRSAKLCAEQQQVMDTLLDQKLHEAVITNPLLGNGLPVDILRQQSQPMQRALLRRWLEWVGESSFSLPSFQQLEQIRQQAQDARADTKMCVQCADYQVRFYQMALWCVPDHHRNLTETFKVTEGGVIDLPEPWGQFVLPEQLINEHEVELSAGLLRGKWQHARRKGSKTMADWVKQAQIPPWLRQSTPYISIHDTRVWVPAVGWLTTSGSSMEDNFESLAEPQWLTAAN